MAPLVCLAASSSLQLQALVSKLLARAVGACLACEDAHTAHTVVLEMQQAPPEQGLLVLRGSVRQQQRHA